MQIPITKHQITHKREFRNSKFETSFGIRKLEIGAYLVFGNWDLGFARRARFGFTPLPERYGRETIDEWRITPEGSAGQCHGRKPMVTGFTLMEVVITTGIIGLIMLGVGVFQANIFGYNTSLSNQLTSQHESRRAIEQIIAELRASSYAGNGAYPIESASATLLIFYTNADSDTGIERVRYFLNGSSLQRGLIKPSGTNPVVYTGTETVNTMVAHVVNGATALFTYYDTAYAGSGSPLSSPVNVNAVRYIHTTIIVDKDPNRPPLPLRVEGGTSIRNLKDNL